MAVATGRPIRVVVVTRDSERVIEGLLDSLERGLSGCEWELVVVDNASRRTTPSRSSDEPTARAWSRWARTWGLPRRSTAVSGGKQGA